MASTSLLKVTIMVVLSAMMLAGCGLGQFSGPTLTPSSTNTPLPTATLTPTVIPTPTITPIPTPQALLIDTFDNPQDSNINTSPFLGHPELGKWNISGGVLSWTSTAKNLKEVAVSIGLGNLPSDVDVAVDVVFEKITGQGGAFAGLYCRDDVNSKNQYSYYQFVVFEEGNVEGFLVNKSVNGQLSNLAQSRFSNPALANQAINRLEVICSGNHLRFFINRTSLVDMTDDTLKDGSLYLDYGASAPGTIIDFKNLVVKAP